MFTDTPTPNEEDVSMGSNGGNNSSSEEKIGSDPEQTNGLSLEENIKQELERKVEALRQSIRDHIEELTDVARADPNSQISINNFIELAEIDNGEEFSGITQDRVKSILDEPEFKEIFANYGFAEPEYSERHRTYFLPVKPDMKLPSPEEKTVHLIFSNPHPCAGCKTTVTFEADVPESGYGKIKKDKKTGRKYQDYDYGYVTCRECERQGKRSEVFVYHREWKNES